MIEPEDFIKKNKEWIEYFKALGRGTKKPSVENQPQPIKKS